MKKAIRLFLSVICFGSLLSAGAVYGALSYWDSNDTTAGAGAAPVGTWGISAYWSTNAAGTSATTGWTAANTAVFSAGGDAVNPFTVSVLGSQSVGGMTFEEGDVTVAGGALLMTAGATLNVASASANINSVLVGGALTKTGSGTLFLNGANNFGGLLTVSTGVVAVGNNGALGTAAGATTVSNNAALHVSGNRTVGEPILLRGTGISGAGALLNVAGSNVINGVVSLPGNARINADTGTLVLAAPVQQNPSDTSGNHRQLTVGGAGDTIMAGNTLSGSSSLLTKDGAGVLTVTAYCNHRGGTTINAGTLRLGDSDVLHGASFVSPLVVNGTFDLNGYNEAIDSLTGTGVVMGGGTLTVGGAASAPMFAGVIGGPTALVKVGTNVQIFAGTNTYVGATTVSNGVLRVNGSLAAGSAVSVQAGATLDGAGIINGPVSVAAGGSLSPGANVGTLTLAGGLNLSGGGAYTWELAANSTNNPGIDFDQLVLTGGDLVLGGSATVNIQFTGTATAPDSTNTFWQTNRSWKILSLNGGSHPGNDKFFMVENGSYAAGNFSTSVDADGGILLHFKLPGPVTNEVDFAMATSRAFPAWVRGQSPYRSADNPSFQAMFNMSSPSLMRGIAGGLDADTYDWRVYNSGSKWGATAWGTLVTTLDYLRKCRDTGSEPLLTANMFGGGFTNEFGTMICQFDNFTNVYNPGGFGTNAVAGTAAQLAADWVRYCNFIVPNYRQGQESLIGNDPNFNPIEDEENLRVYNSLALGGNWNGRDLLLTNSEPAVPKAIWWEVGNEPEVDLPADSTLVNQHVIADKLVYRDRYRVIANAMKAVDGSIQTGPCITTPNPSNEWLGRVAEDTNAPLDFVGIHPYYWLRYVWPNTTNLTAGLMQIGRYMADHARNTALTMSNYGGITRSGTKPAGWYWTVPLIASEYNPVNWDATSEVKRSTASGLGLLEHCFRFAHPNRTTNAYQSYLGANYWENPSGVVFLTNAFEALRDFAGDRIYENPFPGPQPVPDFAPLERPLRAYVTQQTNGANKFHFWGLNFSESTDDTVSFVLTNLPFTPRAVFLRSFGRRGAENSLTNSTGLGWTAQEVTSSVNPTNFTLAVENATFGILTLQESAATNWYWDISTSAGLRGGNGTWSTNILHNTWSTSVTGENPALGWADGKDAVFAASLSAGGTITVTGTVAPRAVLVNKSNCNLSGSGTISLGVGGMQINAPMQITNTAGNPTLAGLGGVTVNAGVGNTVTFNCTNIYTGATVIAQGGLVLGSRGGIPNTGRIVLANGASFNVSARTSGLVLLSGQTLAGNGSVVGRVTANGTVSPGTSVGMLTFSTNLALAGTTIMDVSRAGSNVTNDVIACANALTYGGALLVTNSGPDPLLAGDTFALFSAPTNGGSFASIQLPPLSFGLGWNTNGLGTGVLQVVTVPVFSSAVVLGTNLVLSGSNGIFGSPYYMLTATNVALPLSNWSRLLTNSFGAGGGFSDEIPVDPADPTRFFRLQSGH